MRYSSTLFCEGRSCTRFALGQVEEDVAKLALLHRAGTSGASLVTVASKGAGLENTD